MTSQYKVACSLALLALVAVVVRSAWAADAKQAAVLRHVVFFKFKPDAGEAKLGASLEMVTLDQRRDSLRDEDRVADVLTGEGAGGPARIKTFAGGHFSSPGVPSVIDDFFPKGGLVSTTSTSSDGSLRRASSVLIGGFFFPSSGPIP